MGWYYPIVMLKASACVSKNSKDNHGSIDILLVYVLQERYGYGVMFSTQSAEPQGSQR